MNNLKFFGNENKVFNKDKVRTNKKRVFSLSIDFKKNLKKDFMFIFYGGLYHSPFIFSQITTKLNGDYL